MKKILILLLVIPSLSFNLKNSKKQLIGKWIGEDKNKIGYVNFDKKGYAFFEIEGQIFGGEEFTINGKKGKMTYEINDKVEPIQIDLIVTKLESGEQRKILCIASFINKDEMKFALNFENQRPTDFDSENSILFKREK